MHYSTYHQVTVFTLLFDKQASKSKKRYALATSFFIVFVQFMAISA